MLNSLVVPGAPWFGGEDENTYGHRQDLVTVEGKGKL